MNTEQVNHPAHYGDKDSPYEVIKIIKHFGLNFAMGSVLQYVLRAGKKDPNPKIHIQDLRKAIAFLEFEIQDLEDKQNVSEKT